MNTRRGLLLVCCLILFQVVARYCPTPVADFTSDAWSFLELGTGVESLSEALGKGLKEPDRPVQASLLTASFWMLGDNPAAFAVYSVISKEKLG